MNGKLQHDIILRTAPSSSAGVSASSSLTLPLLWSGIYGSDGSCPH